MKIFRQSSLKTDHGLPRFGISEMADLKWLQHAFLTRKGGTSPSPFHSLNVSIATGDSKDDTARNKKVIAEAFQFDPDRLVLLHQKHQDHVLILKESEGHPPSDLDYDAMITDSPNQFLGIKTADCLPILVIDRVKKVIAAIHAGRQGTVLTITPKVLQTMERVFGCARKDLLIALGPSIGVCCYEIDERVFQPELEPHSIPKGNGKWMMDLPRMNMVQIREEGIKEDQIFWIDLCTACNTDLFFSHRKEGRTGRQLSFIGITKANADCR
jgi:YfiH family protein